MINARIMALPLPQEGVLPPEIDTYLSLSDAINMKSLCRPLEELGIHYFLYLKRENDHYLHLTNLPEWLHYFFTQKYYLNCFFHDPSRKYVFENYLWRGLSTQKIIYNDLKHLFGIDHGITLLKSYQNCDEFFYFGTTRENCEIINSFINNCSVLQRFILYFKEALSNNQPKLNQRVIVPVRKSSSEECNKITLKLVLRRYYVGGLTSETYLTLQEVECLRWYIHGKNIPEIAIILGRSPRTVETHLEHIKHKTNCFGRTQLSLRFSELFKNE